MAKRKKTLELPPFPTLTRTDHHWEGRVTLPAWAGFQSRTAEYAGTDARRTSDGTVRVSVAVPPDGSEVPHPTPAQAAAFEHLLRRPNKLRTAVLAAVFAEYPTARKNYAADFDITDPKELARVLPALRGPGGLKAVIGLAVLHVAAVELAGQAYLGFEFGCNWDEEHGLGVLTHAGRVVTVGLADVCFLEWVAEDDARKQRRTRR